MITTVVKKNFSLKLNHIYSPVTLLSINENYISSLKIKRKNYRIFFLTIKRSDYKNVSRRKNVHKTHWTITRIFW